MGTGPAAAKESRKSSKLIEDLMCKGVAKEDAIRVINETLIKSEYETVLAMPFNWFFFGLATAVTLYFNKHKEKQLY